MSGLSAADSFLLDEVRAGKPDGWSRLVERYQGRLLAFARGKLRDAVEAEDLVQETFISFLRGLPTFRGQSSLETFLFAILRRKVIDQYRGRGVNVCLLQDTMTVEGAGEVPGDEPTASWYARRAEDVESRRAALTVALDQLIGGFKADLNFRDLKILEMLFYCQIRNKDIAAVAGVSVNHVAVIKHRALAQIQQAVTAEMGAGAAVGEFAGSPEALLTEVWQEQRLSCPKRSTLGAFLLGTLDSDWADYVAFHAEQLGCRFCQANLDDLRKQTETAVPTVFRDRIMQSTVGFLKKP